jgi:hypothetical protein
MSAATEMPEPEQARVRAWIRNWQELGPKLARLRRESVRQTDTSRAMEALDLAFRSARAYHRPRLTSGLVEQQRWFKRGRP